MVLAGAVVAGVPATREPILRAAGWALVVDDPVEPAVVRHPPSGGRADRPVGYFRRLWRRASPSVIPKPVDLRASCM
jgi:hypothetical protein